MLGTLNSDSNLEPRGRRGGFFRLRVAMLLVVFTGLALYAYLDKAERDARTNWQRSLNVAVVLLLEGEVDADSTREVEIGLEQLEARLTTEFQRYRHGPKPFELSFFGPANVAEPPPEPKSDGALDLVTYTYRQWRYTRAVDSALGLDRDAFDSRIYAVARPTSNPRAQWVEGYSQQGGRIGFVRVELNHSMVPLVLAVTAHELMHTLGATDKYDERGASRVPEGLAQPELEPLYPQRCAEVMARNRPLTREREVPLDSLNELCVGPYTARELRWLDP